MSATRAATRCATAASAAACCSGSIAARCSGASAAAVACPRYVITVDNIGGRGGRGSGRGVAARHIECAIANICGAVATYVNGG